GLFLDAFILDKIPNTSPNLPIAYLAQSDIDNSELSKAMPELEHFSCGPRCQNYRRALWIGPDGTFTPFHKDPYIGLYTHLIGRKRFFLLPPDARQFLDISPDPPYTNTSQIPLPVTRLLSDTPSEDVPPNILHRYRRLLLEAIKMNGACRVVLNAGESVLIPEGWWHSAEGIDGPGIGVNAWFR
ncbi:hypothetical protein TREMEDRAFT_29073, partial [Tremella mesenterica DSM 1558]|uniref:uncharacterized protein n=1 Tax=Tremella mesenterica (strain ATCC 24925 / CBS 8224 / DSM 1558 / NBRC 9311 / NRRL Y-6157 / RJB 2259-6 / UBC 559-6) TaxID=578456 RepID=UPI0003F49D51